MIDKIQPPTFKNQNLIKLIYIYITILALGLIKSNPIEEKLFKKLNKTHTENEAINILNDLIYKNETFTDTNILSFVSEKNWLSASRLIIDFLIEKETKAEEINKNITSIIDKTVNKLGEMRSFFTRQEKKISSKFPQFSNGLKIPS